jgi:hypothetical protein
LVHVEPIYLENFSCKPASDWVMKYSVLGSPPKVKNHKLASTDIQFTNEIKNLTLNTSNLICNLRLSSEGFLYKKAFI